MSSFRAWLFRGLFAVASGLMVASHYKVGVPSSEKERRLVYLQASDLGTIWPMLLEGCVQSWPYFVI